MTSRSALQHLPRGRLLQRLDQLSALTVLTALPGSGKTSLTTEWARRRAQEGDSVTWINATDDEPDDLHAWLHHHIASADCGLGDMATRAQYRACIHSIISADHGDRMIIVIDRVDNVTASNTVISLCELLIDMPGLHVVACSRFRHPIVAEAQHRGLSVNLIDGHDLRATPEEIPLLAKIWGDRQHQPRRDFDKLYTDTGGWIAPARFMLGATPEAGREAAVDYVRTIAIAAVRDSDLLTAAMRLALSVRVTSIHAAEVAAAMPAREDGTWHTAEDLLTRLRNAGIVGTNHGDDNMWSMSPVLRDALASEYASRAAADSAGWHRRLAHALRDSGDPAHAGAAVVHARAADDWLLLIDLWNRSSLNLTYDQADDLVSAYARIPVPALAQHPVLGIPAAIAGALEEQCGSVKTQQALLRALHVAGEPFRHGERLNLDPSGDLHLQLLSGAVMIDRSEGRYERACVAARALDAELTERERSIDCAPQPAHRAWLLHQWAQVLLLAGDRNRALALATRAFAAAHDVAPRTVVVNIAADIALLHSISGELTEARYWLDICARHAPAGHWMDYIARLPAHIARTLVALDCLDPQAAQAGVNSTMDGADQAEMAPFVVHASTQHALVYGDPVVALTDIDRYEALNPRPARAAGVARRIIDRCRADLYLALGEVNLAERHLGDIGSRAPCLRVPQARLHLMCGEPAIALRVASAGVWDPATMVRDRIDLLMIKAAASEALGNVESADQYFTRAVAITTRYGSLRPYLLIDRDTRNSLIGRTGAALDNDVLDRLGNTRDVYPAHADLVSLTERELAVLYQLTRHTSWSGVASALVVAPTTVKKQILSLYAKLDVHDRDAALLRAERLGFLPEPSRPPTESD